MSRKIECITKKAEEAVETMKTRITYMTKTVQSVHETEMYSYIQALSEEGQRLDDLNKTYEVRYVLMYIELERRIKEAESFSLLIRQMQDEQAARDKDNTRKLERIREDEMTKMHRAIASEIEKQRNILLSERAKFEEALTGYEMEAKRKDFEISELKQKLQSQYESNHMYSLQIEDQKRKFNSQQSAQNSDLSRMKAEFLNNVKDLEEQKEFELEQLRRRMQDEKSIDMDRLTKDLTLNFSEQMRAINLEMNQLKLTIETATYKIKDLEAEVYRQKSMVQAKSAEIAELTELLARAHREHEEAHITNEQEKRALKKNFQDYREQVENKIFQESDETRKVLAEKSLRIKSLEEDIISAKAHIGELKTQMEKSHDENLALQGTIHELKREYSKTTISIEEKFTREREEMDLQIEDYIRQLDNLHKLYESKLVQLNSKVEHLENENGLLKKDKIRLTEEGEERRKEIEKWTSQFSGYMTGEEGMNLIEEVQHLRKANMGYQNELTMKKLEVAKVSEQIKNHQLNMQAKDEEIDTVRELVSIRSEEVVKAQAEVDKQRQKIRQYEEGKKEWQALKLLLEEELAKLRDETSYIRQTCEMLQRENESLQTQVSHQNKQTAESLNHAEFIMRKTKAPLVTTTIMSKQCITRESRDDAVLLETPKH
jgi:regulator of replication initiation timing